jgi:hypothetical protein
MLHVASYVLFRSNGSRLSPNGSGSGATPSSRERENTVGATLRVLQQVVARGAGLRCVARCIASRGSACHRRVRIRRFLPPVIRCLLHAICVTGACCARHRRVLNQAVAAAFTTWRANAQASLPRLALPALLCPPLSRPAGTKPARPYAPHHSQCRQALFVCLFVCSTRAFAGFRSQVQSSRRRRRPRWRQGKQLWPHACVHRRR